MNSQALLRIKQIIDHLKTIDTTILTEAEQDAVQDCLQQAYDRATYALQAEKGDADDSTAHTGRRFCYYSA